MSDGLQLQDVIGLKEPLIKLIDVVSSAIGKGYEPLHIKRIADAKAYEMDKISDAIEKLGLKGNVKYSDGEIHLDNDSNIIDGCNSVISRVISKEIKRQTNVDRIIGGAYVHLENTDYVSDEPVNDDWISRFFRIAEDISTEEMQEIWSKILCGEIIKPKTYSLRTLELLKSLSKYEADLFVKVAKYAIQDNRSCFILGDTDYLSKSANISFSDLLYLEEIGLIINQVLIFESTKATEPLLSQFKYGEYVLNCYIEKESTLQFNVIKITKIGSELLNFIDPVFDSSYLEYFAKKNRIKGIEYKYAKIESYDGRRYSHSSEVSL